MSEMLKCEYCKKDFKRERTFLSHVCVKKKRMIDKDTRQSRMAFQTYCHFMRRSGQRKEFTFRNFVDSKFYMEFIKFARFIYEQNVIDPIGYLNFLYDHGTASKFWRTGRTYQMFLREHLCKEPVERALERTFITLQEWAEQNDSEWQLFFKDIGPIELTQIIRSGNISPWVIYLSESAGRAIDQLSEEQGDMIASVIDPGVWHKIFTARHDDVGFAQEVILSAGI